MLRCLFVAAHLLIEASTARRDARVRFLQAQVEILRRKLGGNRVVPRPDDRTRLLTIGREFNHDVADVIGIVTPRTYARWVRDQRHGRNVKPVGQPKVSRNVRETVVRLAHENASWGFRRIVGELHKLRLHVGRSSVRRILTDEGLSPSPTRRSRAEDTVWRKFIEIHMNTLVACEFFSKKIVTPFTAKATCGWLAVRPDKRGAGGAD
jgi:putative transposase